MKIHLTIRKTILTIFFTLMNTKIYIFLDMKYFGGQKNMFEFLN